MSTYRIVFGTMTTGMPITDQTPEFESYKADANTTYIRYEDTTSPQYIEKVVTDGTSTKKYRSTGLWTDRGSLTYRGINQ